MKSAERVWKVWVNVSEVEHTSERVRESGAGAEGLRKIVEGLRRVADWSGNADGSRRSAELSVP